MPPVLSFRGEGKLKTVVIVVLKGGTEDAADILRGVGLGQLFGGATQQQVIGNYGLLLKRPSGNAAQFVDLVISQMLEAEENANPNNRQHNPNRSGVQQQQTNEPETCRDTV